MCVLLYSVLVDRTMNLCVIRAGQDGWTGLSSCTLIASVCLMSRYLVYIVHSFNGIEAGNIFLIFYHYSWGFHWKARTPTDRWRSTSLYGTDIKRCVDGSEEANDIYNFYTMDGTGSEVKGQA